MHETIGFAVWNSYFMGKSGSGNGGKKNATDCPEEIDIKAYQARTPSDHFPVKVELVFEGEEQK